jgi:Tfp pilus assembly protein PilF
MQYGVLAAVCALVVGVYAYAACSGVLESFSLNAADTTHYNLLVQGFRAGHLSLKKEVPPALAQLADPYDPTANAPYRFEPYWMLDLSYYNGKLYLYYGVTPVLILFWPFVALTGRYLFHREAVAIFCAMGFLANVGLLRALWKRYFAEVSIGVVAACVLALGLATGLPVMLPRSDVYEVAVSCGYMLAMLALGAIWCALHEPERRWRWLATASLVYGLAVGARPSLLFGAVILLVPVVEAWRERRPIWVLLTAATAPIILIGLGLMLYNFLRFGNPFEFGWHYTLDSVRVDRRQYFSLHYLLFNFRVYFLQLSHWSSRFPFVHETALPPLPAGYGGNQTPVGILTNIPLVWLVLAAPLAWRGRPADIRSKLCGFLAAVVMLFGICALTMSSFPGALIRFEVEFLPALVLLAVVGILGLERTLAAPGAWMADRPVWRWTVRLGWGLLLGFSVAFNLFAGAANYAEAQYYQGNALFHAGRIQEAMAHIEQALRIKPDHAEAHCNMGEALAQVGKLKEAIVHYEQALRIKPDYAEAHNNLGVALAQVGRLQEAMEHWEQTLRIEPNYAEAHNNLGTGLLGLGKAAEAMEHYEQALRLNPNFALAHYNTGVVLERASKLREAIGHYEQALRLKPGYAEAQNSLSRLRAVQ